MKKYLACLFLILQGLNTFAQCNTTDATDCLCPGGADTCDLIPNIKISYDMLIDPNENPETTGELRISVSTPNTGRGPLKVIGSDFFVCDQDTIQVPGGNITICPDGRTLPRQLVKQVVYRKEGTTMKSYERWAGSMTYHPTHSHMHFDDWGIYSLRIPQAGVTNPLDWPIVGKGSKLGFCLMDYGSCNNNGYYGYCRDDNNNVITNNIPNYGLGGGGFSCGTVDQGISVGYLDIYHHYLDGMFITLPPGTCNGDYMLVVQADPNNVLLEENDGDNIMVAPIRLTKQTATAANMRITVPATHLCGQGNIQASVPNIGSAYLWSNGSTTSTTNITTAGDYYCHITTPCGSSYSDTIHITQSIMTAPQTTNETVCPNQTATLTASIGGSTNGTINWYDALTAGNLVHTGNTLVLPNITTTQTYFVANELLHIGTAGRLGPIDHNFGTGGFLNSGTTTRLNFTALRACKLVSAWVDAQGTSDRTIKLYDATNQVIFQKTINIPAGQGRILLDIDIPAAGDYSIGGTNMNLYRNNSGAQYPYSLANIINLTGTSAGANFYYYFYDIEVKLPDEICVSTRTQATATVQSCIGVNMPTELNTYNVLPNPNNGKFEILLSLHQKADIQYFIFDASGQRISAKNIGEINGLWQEQVDLKDLARGVYIVQIFINGKPIYKKIVVE